MQISDKNRILEFYNDSSSNDEDFLTTLYMDSSNEPELKGIAKEHWEKVPSTKIDLQHILHRIHFQINSNPIKKPVLSRILSAYYRVAAVLLIPILTVGMYLVIQNLNSKNSYAEITALKGSRVQFTLPDGSVGYLNSESKLKYPVNFSKNRNVDLIGEGYFEVVKDKKHPFTVKTNYADIKVFGTKFDVCAYETDFEIYTTLEEGSVQVYNKVNNTYSLLAPGIQNMISKSSGKMKNIPVKTELYTSWKDDMLKFNNSPFDEVVKKIERWYGVKVTLEKGLKYTDNYTFTVKTESLKELLQLLAITTPMGFKIEGDNVTIFSKQIKPIYTGK